MEGPAVNPERKGNRASDNLRRRELAVPRDAITRRKLLRQGASLGVATTGLAFLAACGDDGGSSKTSSVEALGASGVADRAIEGARGLTGVSEMTLVYPSGAAANFEPFFGEWEELTGHRIQGFEVPINEYADKILGGAAAQRSDWDVVDVNPRFYGDLIGAQAIVTLDDFVKNYDPMISDGKWGFVRNQDRYFTEYDSQVYGLDADGDVFTYVYRSDLFENPDEAAAFEEAHGRPLGPATTWEEFNELAEFFTRPDENLWGAAELIGKGWSFWYWQLRYAAQAQPNAYYFDDEMRPLIASPEGVRATELIAELRPFVPEDVTSWSYTESYNTFVEGNAAQECAWSSLVKFCNTPDTSKVVGKFATADMPGRRFGDDVHTRTIAAFGGSLAVWAHSENQEAAYLFSQWITSPEISPRMLAQPGFSDPYRITDAESPEVREIYTPEYMDTYNARAEIAVPEILLLGSTEYSSALDDNVQAAFVGDASAEEAMQRTADAWEEITDRLGRDQLIEAWGALKSTYPDA